MDQKHSSTLKKISEINKKKNIRGERKASQSGWKFAS